MIWELCDDVGAPRIAPGLLHQWRKGPCEGNGGWAFRILKDLAGSGKLDKPVGYLKKALENMAREGKFKERERPPMFDSEEDRKEYERILKMRADGLMPKNPSDIYGSGSEIPS
jgi:hypothetical protein